MIMCFEAQLLGIAVLSRKRFRRMCKSPRSRPGSRHIRMHMHSMGNKVFVLEFLLEVPVPKSSKPHLFPCLGTPTQKTFVAFKSF